LELVVTILSGFFFLYDIQNRDIFLGVMSNLPNKRGAICTFFNQE